MNIEPKRENPSLSDELTVVFLRGNGSPRTFRVPLVLVQRALTAISFSFCLAVLAAIFFFGLNLLHPSDYLPSTTPPPVAIAPTAPAPTPMPAETPAETGKPGLWQKLAGSGTSASSSDSELKKEVDGLHQDIARLNSQIDSRKDLPKKVNDASVLQLFGPRSVVMTEAETNIRVKNAKFIRDPGAKDVTLSFELHNIDPAQKQERGYIVAIAKTSDMLLVYPPTAFNPSQNIVLDFTKGETFGISRFRAATATFSAAALANKQVRFQILLFSTDGRIIANQHVEEKP